jgi:hypothetical protein
MPASRSERAVGLLSAAVVVLVWSFVTRIGVATDRWWATGVLVLGWLEYVNYFRLQLMHDTVGDVRRLVRTRRLRPSALARDLARHRGGSRSAGVAR